VSLHRLWIGYMSELLALNPRPSSLSQPPPPRRPRGESTVEGDGATTGMGMGMPQAAGMHAKLVKADFHGSIMTGQFRFCVLLRRRKPRKLKQWLFFPPSLKPVLGKYFFTVRRSKNAALVGASGIVVQETENTFKVVTRKNKLKGSDTSF
jgi:ribonuclease P protein subunit POP4